MRAGVRACVHVVNISSNFKFTISGMHLSLAKQDRCNKMVI